MTRSTVSGTVTDRPAMSSTVRKDPADVVPFPTIDGGSFVRVPESDSTFFELSHPDTNPSVPVAASAERNRRRDGCAIFGTTTGAFKKR